MYHFHIFTKEEKETFLTDRPGETRMGKGVYCINEQKSTWPDEVKFVLIGAPEDIGVKANCGIGGAGTACIPFLKSFLNLQETAALSGKSFLLYGCLRREASVVPDPESSLETLRRQTEQIDEILFPEIQKVVAAGKIPIVIGGGHNNAYPLLKGASLAIGSPVNALNIDAHADFRAIEGRHSGNGFSYAFLEGYLKKYFALGLHEAYNSREMLQNMTESAGVEYIFWEDVFLRKKISWSAAITNAIKHASDGFFGTELDVDCIENVLSSAATPIGIQAREAMEALYQCGKNPQAIYLHIPEAVAQRADGLQNPFAGKLLSYLVQAFTKGVLERK